MKTQERRKCQSYQQKATLKNDKVCIPVTLRAYSCYPRSSKLPHMRGHAGANFFFPSLQILGPPRHRVRIDSYMYFRF